MSVCRVTQEVISMYVGVSCDPGGHQHVCPCVVCLYVPGGRECLRVCVNSRQHLCVDLP